MSNAFIEDGKVYRWRRPHRGERPLKTEVPHLNLECRRCHFRTLAEDVPGAVLPRCLCGGSFARVADWEVTPAKSG